MSRISQHNIGCWECGIFIPARYLLPAEYNTDKSMNTEDHTNGASLADFT